MATQDELAALFSRNLSLHPTYIAPKQEPTQVEEPYTYSISQHYHHSAHISHHQPTRPSSEPPQTEQLSIEVLLSKNGVDPSSLYPSQIDLFRTADDGQRLRLVELWRICPPEYSQNTVAQNIGTWSTTSLPQEEAMAKVRYERMMMEERLARTGGDQQGLDSDTMSDASTNQPLTPIQGGDSRWFGTTHIAEPYMTSGYEALAHREYEQSAGQSKDIYSHFGTAVGGPKYNQATDPVYNTVADIHKFSNVGGDWAKLLEQKQQAMENQYGAFQQHLQHNNGGATAVVYQGDDEEML